MASGSADEILADLKNPATQSCLLTEMLHRGPDYSVVSNLIWKPNVR